MVSRAPSRARGSRQSISTTRIKERSPVLPDDAPKKPDLKSLEALRIKGEEFVLKGKVFYLHTPDGFGPSKLVTRIEKHLGVQGTARNWRTVTTLVGMVSALSD
jgi:uncharacterized protein (DUF1697 family)